MCPPMSEHIQPLIDRIRAEGLKKAEAERDALLEKARAEAEQIRAKAEADAKALIERAEAEAEAAAARGTAALKQAVRDNLLQFRAELLRQLETLARQAAAGALAGGPLVSELISGLVRSRGATGGFTIEAGSELAAKLETLLPALLRELGADGGADIRMNPRSGEGFTLQFKDSAAVIDLSDEAIAGWLAAYLRPELAELLKTPEGS